MRARAGYIYIRGEFVNERKAVMRAIGESRGRAGGSHVRACERKVCALARRCYGGKWHRRGPR